MAKQFNLESLEHPDVSFENELENLPLHQPLNHSCNN